MDYCAAFDICICCYKGFKLSNWIWFSDFIKYKELYALKHNAMNWNPKPMTCIIWRSWVAFALLGTCMHEPKALHMHAVDVHVFACCQAEPVSAKYFDPPVGIGVWWTGSGRTPSEQYHKALPDHTADTFITL